MDSRFRDIPADAFPFTIRAFDKRGELVWSETVEQPGAVYVPPLSKEHGPVTIEVEFADGTSASW